MDPKWSIMYHTDDTYISLRNPQTGLFETRFGCWSTSATRVSTCVHNRYEQLVHCVTGWLTNPDFFASFNQNGSCVLSIVLFCPLNLRTSVICIQQNVEEAASSLQLCPAASACVLNFMHGLAN